jgi:YHS domain-containing protein
MDRDVVCGMQVEPAAAAATSQYNGKTYYFCSPSCRWSLRDERTRAGVEVGLLEANTLSSSSTEANIDLNIHR